MDEGYYSLFCWADMTPHANVQQVSVQTPWGDLRCQRSAHSDAVRAFSLAPGGKREGLRPSLPDDSSMRAAYSWNRNRRFGLYRKSLCLRTDGRFGESAESTHRRGSSERRCDNRTEWSGIPGTVWNGTSGTSKGKSQRPAEFIPRPLTMEGLPR